MTTKIVLKESVAEAPVKKGNKWRVIVARPGRGSSANYSAEVLKRDAAKIVPAGAQAFINHDDKRNPKDMFGTYPNAAYWDEAEQAVVSEVKVFKHWVDFVEEVGPHCGMSLYAMGEIDDDENVVQFTEDTYNGADLVARPGLAGSGLAEKLYEAAKAASDKTSSELSEQGRKEIRMDEKDIAAIGKVVAEAVAGAVAPLVSANTAKVEQEAQAKVNEDAVAEALKNIQSSVDAVEAERENLSTKQVESLRAKAFAGEDVTDAITEAKETRAAILAEAETDSGSEGRLLGEAKTTQYGAWK